MDNYRIGQRIRAYRKLKNISRQSLADKINVPINHIGQIERGEIIYISEFIEVCSIIGLPLSSFCSELNGEYYKKIISKLDGLSDKELEIVYRMLMQL